MDAVKFSPAKALQWLGVRQTIRGAIVIGLLAGIILGMQGYLYVQLYPDPVSQRAFAETLSLAPQLGFLYGDADNLYHGPNGYMVYRAAQTLAVIMSVWGLLVATRLLRGSEEEGRWEVVRSGAITARRAQSLVMAGFIYSWLVAFAIGTIIVMSIGRAPELQLTAGAAILTMLSVFLPALFWAAVGMLTSQLSVTRRKAVFYGIVPLVVFYLLRGLGNTDPSFAWLLAWSPSGWTDLVSPIFETNPTWLLAFVGGVLLFSGAATLLATRDLGSSVVPERQKVRSFPYLLGNAWQLAYRLNIGVFMAWLFGTLLMTGLVASIIDVASEATRESPQLAAAIQALADNRESLEIAYLSAGFVFVAMVLMLYATTLLGSIRGDEAKQYLDTILAQPQSRVGWLIGRLILGVLLCLKIALLAGLVTYAFATSKGLDLDLMKVLADSFAILGTIIFLLGFGALFYGFLPRLTVASMAIVIGWSFIIDILRAVVDIGDILLHSSLFHYVNFNLADWPDWQTFAWLAGLGVIMAAIGIWAFTNRDIVTE